MVHRTRSAGTYKRHSKAPRICGIEARKVIGFATYHVANDEKTAELSWIGMWPEFHRTGIGRALVNAIEADLAQRGVQALVVSTVASTVEYEPYARTRRFYRAIGFSNVQVDMKWYPSGDDRLLLRKQSFKKPHVQSQAY